MWSIRSLEGVAVVARAADDRLVPGRRPAPWAALGAACAGLTAGRLVLDLRSEVLIDSAGLTALVAVIAAVQAGGGRIAVCTGSPSVLAVLASTRLDRLVAVFSKVGEAAAAVRR